MCSYVDNYDSSQAVCDYVTVMGIICSYLPLQRAILGYINPVARQLRVDIEINHEAKLSGLWPVFKLILDLKL